MIKETMQIIACDCIVCGSIATHWYLAVNNECYDIHVGKCGDCAQCYVVYVSGSSILCLHTTGPEDSQWYGMQDAWNYIDDEEQRVGRRQHVATPDDEIPF